MKKNPLENLNTSIIKYIFHILKHRLRALVKIQELNPFSQNKLYQNNILYMAYSY